jgi:hypothetical protein
MNDEIPPGTSGFGHEDKSYNSLDDFLSEGLEEAVRSQSQSSNAANNGIVGPAPSPPVTPQSVPPSHQHVAENSPRAADADSSHPNRGGIRRKRRDILLTPSWIRHRSLKLYAKHTVNPIFPRKEILSVH